MHLIQVSDDQKKIYEYQKKAYEIIMSVPHNIIFLDVDGVLNTNYCKEQTPQGFIGIMDSRVKVLAEIARRNHAAIILSASWKDFWTRDFPQNGLADSDALYLMQKLADQGVCAADKTADAGYNRGSGIRKWLLKHPHKQFIVLDDEIFGDYNS